MPRYVFKVTGIDCSDLFEDGKFKTAESLSVVENCVQADFRLADLTARMPIECGKCSESMLRIESQKGRTPFECNKSCSSRTLIWRI